MLSPDTLVLDGRFRVLRPLGAGGMGEVYLAEQVSLGRKVAIKVLHRDLHVQPGMAERFRREARLLSAVEHPAVVRVIEYGESGDAPCLVMELVDGESLHNVLRNGALPLPRALLVLHQLAEGLAAIHEKGIVHRDLKPENVFLTRGVRGGEQARLLDFGIARLVEGDAASNVSQVGVVLGTPEYLSPEQATGARVDARSDLYSFGVLAYRVLSGRLPFAGPSPRQFLAQHAAAPPLPLTDAAPGLAAHPALVELVMRLLEKDPTLRPASALALGQVLGAEAARLGVLPATTGGFAPVPEGAAPGAFPRATALFGAVQPEAAAPSVPSPPSQAQRGGTALFGAAAPARTGVAATGAASTGSLQGRTQNVALMLTDIQGYTARTSSQTREESARMLETHDRLLLPLVRSHGGRVVQKRGDALLALFPSPTESVHCGMAIQDRLWRHNRAARAGDELHVRVCLHAGEVLVSRDGVLGEPLEVVAAVEKVAEADEVVFTEAVNLARNRAEAAAEPAGSLALAGRGESLQLYRCVRAPEGLPFGGRDAYARASALDVLRARAASLGTHSVDVVRTGAAHLRRTTLPGLRAGAVHLRRSTLPGLRAGLGLVGRKAASGLTALRTAGPRLQGLPRRLGALPSRTRWAMGGGVLALALLVLLTVLHLRSPATQARSLLADGRPGPALRVLDAVPAAKAKGDGTLRQLRAQALHALQRHEDEHATLAALDPGDRDDVEARTLDGLAADFGEDEGDRGVRRLLEGFEQGAVRSRFEDLAEGEASAQQWGALRYLEAQQATQGLDLVEVYAGSLRSPQCAVRARAARRLAALGDDDAVPALERLRALPKERGLLGGRNCGQDEAEEALQILRRKTR